MPNVEPIAWDEPVLPELERIDGLQHVSDLSAHVNAFEAAHEALQKLLSEADQ